MPVICFVSYLIIEAKSCGRHHEHFIGGLPNLSTVCSRAVESRAHM